MKATHALLIIALCFASFVAYKAHKNSEARLAAIHTLTAETTELATELENRTITVELSIGGRIVYDQIPVGSSVHVICDEDRKFIELQFFSNDGEEQNKEQNTLATHGQ